MLKLATLATAAFSLAIGALANQDGLKVKVKVGDGLLANPTDGRVIVMFAPEGVDPLEDYDVTSSPNKIFGKNVFGFRNQDSVTLSAGGEGNPLTQVYGWPNASLDEIPAGKYSIQAFLTKYEKSTRSDGSTVNVRFPCGDGAPNIDGYGSLTSTLSNVTVQGGPQTIELTFIDTTEYEVFTGKEIGGCSQGNYADTATMKYIKIRSNVLSSFWKRDMYVGANVVLPHGYAVNDTHTRYPVIYSQGHWPGPSGAFNYPDSATFKSAWDAGVIPATNASAPKFILVTFRHEAPFYDDSYAVNTPNIGPYGDAINDELIPYLDKQFNTIAQPYARILEGGSTGGWISAATMAFRPDLFGACFASYPDSLDFHRHQDIPLYDGTNAYTRPDGSKIPSIRKFRNDTEVILTTVEQENHWELAFGTNSRSFLQWDVWNAVFGAQGINGYPLEPWDKVTGAIVPGAVAYWPSYDIAAYVLAHWDDARQLGRVLKHRMLVYVGTYDNYFLNEGVVEFEKRVNARGGAGWANVTITPGKRHGGNYQDREIWDYLQLVDRWVKDHAPDGKTPLESSVTVATSRGNLWDEVINERARKTALARQEDPKINGQWLQFGKTVGASVGRWDPGVALQGQWFINGRPDGGSFVATQGESPQYTASKWSSKGLLQLRVIGTKRGLVDETRQSNYIIII